VVQVDGHTARHIATEYVPLDFRKLKRSLALPLIVGKVVTYEACLELMSAAWTALLIGVGPGAACTSREVLGSAAAGHGDGGLRRRPDFFYKRRDATSRSSPTAG